MILSDATLRRLLADGTILLDPYTPEHVQPASVDVTLGSEFLLFFGDRRELDPLNLPERLMTRMKAGESGFWLHPGGFVLGTTVERLTLPADIVCRVEGKALAVETPIPTPSGWTTMQQIEPGEFVYGSNGQPVPVVAATNVLRDRPCYRVEFMDGTTIIADAQHQWVTESKNDRRCRRPQQVRTTEQLAKDVRIGARLQEANYRIYNVAIEGEEQTLPIDPYLLGVWLGDGTSSTAALTLNNRDAGDIFEELLRRKVAVGPCTEKRGAIQCRVGMNGPRAKGAGGRFCWNGSLNSILRERGLLGNKHIPAAYLRADQAQRLSLLQGLMDTDGYVNLRGDQAELTFANKRLSDGAYELLCSLGVSATRDSRPAKIEGRIVGDAHRLRFRPSPDYFCVERKRCRVRRDERWLRDLARPYRSISRVDPVESQPVRCIQVGAADGLFLASEAFIPTHNSSLGRLGLLVHATAGFVDPGFEGQITLELANVSPCPIKLTLGMKIAQLSFMQMDRPAERPYGHPELGSRYQGQAGPVASRYGR